MMGRRRKTEARNCVWRWYGSGMNFLRVVSCGFVLGVVLPGAALAATSSFQCALSEKEPVAERANRFLLETLKFSPVEATQAGYHGDASAPLDAQLDHSDPLTIVAERALWMKGKECFAGVKSGTQEEAVDIALLRDSIESSLFQLDVLQTYKYRPQDPVEMIGSGLFFPLTDTKGNETDRLSGVVARMEQIPKVLDEARGMIHDSDPVWIETAMEENDGNLDVVKMVGERIAAGSPLRARYDAAAKAATTALLSYGAWLKDDLSKRPHKVTWRTGAKNYERIFQFALGPGTHETPDSVLAAAEADLAKVRGEMYTVAGPLHKEWFGDHTHSDLSGDALENKVIAEVIDKINQDHVEPAGLLDEVKKRATGIREFIVKKDLMTLSERDNMRIVPTPVFLREAYSVAGFHSAPALDPTGEAEYWVTPIEVGPNFPKERAESKLREYNNWMLQYLTMHEALPGHYTQFEHANNLQPESRRVLRALLENGPYVEGWGEYAVKEMEDAGYADHDPRFVLMVQKIRLRVIANSILDIRMQSRGMTDEEAFDLMEKKGFQTHAEAQGKLKRAKLGAGQLITYYVGYHQWIGLRERLQKQVGAGFSLKKFNDAALDEGPLPIPLLEPLMDAKFGVQ